MNQILNYSKILFQYIIETRYWQHIFFKWTFRERQAAHFLLGLKLCPFEKIKSYHLMKIFVGNLSLILLIALIREKLWHHAPQKDSLETFRAIIEYKNISLLIFCIQCKLIEKLFWLKHSNNFEAASFTLVRLKFQTLIIHCFFILESLFKVLLIFSLLTKKKRGFINVLLTE